MANNEPNKINEVPSIAILNGKETIMMLTDQSGGVLAQYDAQAFINLIRNSFQISSRNLAPNSKEIILTSNSETHRSYRVVPYEVIKPNTEYTLIIEKTEITIGTETPQFSIVLYDPTTGGLSTSFLFPVAEERKYVTFKSGNLPNDGYVLLMYAGITGTTVGRGMKWTKVMLIEGNIPVNWMPAPEEMVNS